MLSAQVTFCRCALVNEEHTRGFVLQVLSGSHPLRHDFSQITSPSDNQKAKWSVQHLPVDGGIRSAPEGIRGGGGDAAQTYVYGDAAQVEAQPRARPGDNLLVGQHQAHLGEVEPGIEEELLGEADLEDRRGDFCSWSALTRTDMLDDG